MKLFKLSVLFFVVLVSHTGICTAGSEIVVTGEGYENIEPNRVTIKISIRTLEDEQIESAEENAKYYEKLVSILEGMGYGRDSTYTLRYTVDPHYKTYKDKRKFVGYMAYHLVEMTTGDINKAGEIVDATRIEGVSRIKEIKYWSSKMDRVERAALKKAVQNAHLSAQAMAEAASGELGALIELTTNYPENPTYKRKRRNSDQALALKAGIVKVRSTSIVPKKVGIRITVLGRWKFIGPEAETKTNE